MTVRRSLAVLLLAGLAALLGGTAPEQVRAQIARHRTRLGVASPQRSAISPTPAS